ncbi:Hcp1 family type VI secretion system effector [Caballeronia pedi]|uniref:Hcp1 family type VI secretion system effector n=1 Tax=Caballeronia pedi TaxID=1777141 RepID=A0A158B341_9BURK|nr:type VI secretion system tube protein Hcp [Caballeronia pedi]SAK64146.1 Hcp1 family type VI secretion system effector [Caballeronia pedi]
MSDTNIFMKIAGVKGEAAAAGHVGEIDVLSWQWEMHQDARGESRHKRATIENMNFVQRVNLASSSLLQMLLQNTVASEGVLTVLAPNAQSSTTPLGKIIPPKPTLQIFMKKVMVHRIVPYGTAYGHFENVVISFEEFKREYTPQSIEGVACGVATVLYRMCDD